MIHGTGEGVVLLHELVQILFATGGDGEVDADAVVVGDDLAVLLDILEALQAVDGLIELLKAILPSLMWLISCIIS